MGPGTYMDWNTPGVSEVHNLRYDGRTARVAIWVAGSEIAIFLSLLQTLLLAY